MIAVAVVAVFAAAFLIRGRYDVVSPSGISSPSGTVYYYGADCPHCREVAAFLEENDIAGKVSFDRKEAQRSLSNWKEMLEKARSCGLSEEQIGVPFLYADGHCHVGTPDVLSAFREKAGLPAVAE